MIAHESPRRATLQTPVHVVNGDSVALESDLVAGEEPLEIRLRVCGRTIPVAVTMRTPGNDFELAAGFLYGEGIVRTTRDITHIGYCLDVRTAATTTV